MTEMLYKPMPRRAEALHRHEAASRVNLGLRPGLLLLLLGAVGLLFLLTLAAGSVAIPLDQIITVLLGGDAQRASWTDIVLKLRLPRALAAVLAGAALGVSGLMMQTFFRNPLAGPYVLGVSSGASLGVALVVLSAGTTGAIGAAVGGALMGELGLSGDLLLAAAAAVGAGLTLLIVMLAAGRVRSSMALLILGMLMGYFVSAVVSLLLYFAVPERIQAYLSWTFGSFNGVTWQQMPILAGAVLAALGAALLLSKPLNALLLGEDYARSLGLNVRRLRVLVVAVTAVLAGAVTAFCGPIGFVGVAVPHLARGLLNTSDHRVLLPGSLLTGAAVALVAAVVAEVPGSNVVLPLNAVTALIGAPVVMVVILRQRNLQRAFAA